MDQESLKQLVAQHTANLVFADRRDEVVLGVGTGSTVDCFIDQIPNYKSKITAAVSSSERSTESLRSLDIHVISPNDVDSVDVYVDGADEVDPSFALTKGGGGAHTREKIVAVLSQVFICIVDESKCVDRLGAFPIPLEVLQIATNAVVREVEALGGVALPRDGFVTDNGHAILDVKGLSVDDPDDLEITLNNIPGVVEAGIFARNRPDRVVVGSQQGVSELERRF